MNDQLQVFGRIGIVSSAAIRDMARNSFLDRPTKNKEMSDKKTSIFHDFPKELQITAIMCVVQESSGIRKLDTNAMER